MPRKKIPPTKKTTQQIYDGVWFKTEGGFHLICCDCCLTHFVEFRLEDGVHKACLTVDQKETANQRRINGLEQPRRPRRSRKPQ
jgi:hypothetical protein